MPLFLVGKGLAILINALVPGKFHSLILLPGAPQNINSQCANNRPSAAAVVVANKSGNPVVGVGVKFLMKSTPRIIAADSRGHLVWQFHWLFSVSHIK